MSEKIILGTVCDTWLAGEKQVALLKPLYALDEESGDWLEITDPEQKFPNRGGITWMQPDPADRLDRGGITEVQLGSVWRFTYELHPSFDPSDRKHDRYRINWSRLPEPLEEVLDIQAESAQAALKKLEHGLSLRFVPSRVCYIALGDQGWAGPVKLVQECGRWMLDRQKRNLPIPLVDPLPAHQLVKIDVDGERCFLRYNAPAPTQIGKLDWSPDKVLFQRLLKEAHKSPHFAGAHQLTKAAIKQVVETLTNRDADLTNQQLARARAYLADAERLQADLAAFEQELLSLPAIRDRITRAVQEGRESARAEAEEEAIARARAELEQLCEERRQLAGEIDQQRAEMRRRAAELGDLDTQIAERRRQLNDQIALADDAMAGRIAELVARPAEALVQIALVRAALGNERSGRSEMIPSPREVTPPTIVLHSGENLVEDQDQFVKIAQRALGAAGLPGSAGIAIHGALVAGMVPLLGGPGALEALEQYAHAAAGGRMLWVNIVPSALEPADLLGRYDPHTGRFLPHPSGLLDLLIYAGRPDQRNQLFLVVLDGVNRAAVDTYLQPLLACYRSS